MIPPVFKVDSLGGPNATHNLLGIRIVRDAPCFDAILAQEKFEWWYLRKWGALCMAPFVIAAPFVSWWLLAVAAIAHILGPRWPANLRKMELIGKTIEALVAAERYSEDFDAYLRKEAMSLRSYSQFKGWGTDRIERAMREVIPTARKHV